jgi:hypothetical protein
MKYMQEEIRTNQEKADAIHKEMMAKIDDTQERLEPDRKTDRDEMKQDNSWPGTHARGDQN